MSRKKILVVTLSNLGDAVLTLGVFEALQQSHAGAELHVLVSSRAKVIFENEPSIQKIILYDKKNSWHEKWTLLRQVRGEHYDILVDLRRSLIGLWGGAKKRNSYRQFFNKKRHRADKHLAALKGILKIPTAPPTAEVGWLKRRIQNQRALPLLAELELDPGKRLVVAAVGSKSDIKKWPPKHYAKLLDRLVLEQGCRVLLVGDASDKPDAEQVKSLMTSSVLDLTGRTSFDELLAVISRAALVITNDSAPLHVADSLKVPVLALFGPTDPRQYGPRSGGSVAVSRWIFCSPCESAQCRYHHECLEDLSADEVYQKSILILNDQTRQAGLKILLLRLDRIGDVVLSLPAIEALRRQFPDARISVLLRPATKQLLEGHPAVDEVLTYDYEKKGRHASALGYFRLMQELMRRRFDVAFIMHPGVRSALLPFLAGIPYRVGYKDRWNFLQTLSVEDRRGLGLKHESEYALDLVQAFGANIREIAPPKLYVSKLESARVADEALIVMHPGSSCPSKRWPLERFEILGKKILEEFPHRIAVVGGQEEVPMGRQLQQALGSRALDRTGKLDLKELAALLSKSALLISNDSGPVHVAAAVGTRVISVFGRNQAGLSPRRWRPLGAQHAVIQKDVGCVVCMAHLCPIEFECLKAIAVEEVMAVVRQMLSAKARVSPVSPALNV